jgi:hypothetical protein
MHTNGLDHAEPSLLRTYNGRNKQQVMLWNPIPIVRLPKTGVNNMPAPYTGGCQCGSVRYVLTMEPIRLGACHCKECQRQSGSAFGLAMPIKKDSLTVTGPTKQFTRVADSGNEVTGVFCSECGVRIYHMLKSMQDVLSLKPGTLDDTSWLRPGYFIWLRSAQGWVPVPNGVETFEGPN